MNNKINFRFFIDTKTVDHEKYFQSSYIGSRIYCGRDPITTLPKARVVIRM